MIRAPRPTGRPAGRESVPRLSAKLPSVGHHRAGSWRWRVGLSRIRAESGRCRLPSPPARRASAPLLLACLAPRYAPPVCPLSRGAAQHARRLAARRSAPLDDGRGAVRAGDAGSSRSEFSCEVHAASFDFGAAQSCEIALFWVGPEAEAAGLLCQHGAREG